MSGISLQFGPEWMRSKQVSTLSSTARPSQPMLSPTTQLPTSPLYSSFVTNRQGKDGSSVTFKYSKEEMLQIWMDGGGQGPLGARIELWEGIVKELGGDPIGLKELNDSEKRLFASPLNSELRRRQSHDIIPNSLERPKLSHSPSNTQNSPGQPRFSPLLAKRRKEESTDSIISPLRRLSLVSPLSPTGGPMSPTVGLLSPRVKWGANSPALENVIIEGNWPQNDGKREDILNDAPSAALDHSSPGNGQAGESTDFYSVTNTVGAGKNGGDKEPITSEEIQGVLIDSPSLEGGIHKHLEVPELGDYDISVPIKEGFSVAPPGFELDSENITWVYRDPKGNIQGPFATSLMQKWYEEGYFSSDLLVKRSQLDDNWIRVGELAVQARNGKPFTRPYPEYNSPGFFSGNSLFDSSKPFDHFHQPLVQSDGHDSRRQTVLRQTIDLTGMLDSYANASSGSIPISSITTMLPVSHQEFGLQQALSDEAAVLQPVVSRSANFEHSAAYRNDHIGYSRVDNEYPISVDHFRTFIGSHGVHADGGVLHNGPGTAMMIPFSQSLYSTSLADSAYNVPSSLSTCVSSYEKKPLDGLGMSEALSNSEELQQNVAFVTDTPSQISNKRPDPKKESAPAPLDQYIFQNSQLYSSDSMVLPTTAHSPPAQETASTDGVTMEAVESMQLGLTSIKLNRRQPDVPPGKENGILERLPKRSSAQIEASDESHAIAEANKGHLEAASIASVPSVSISVSSKPAWKNLSPVADEVKLNLREIQEAEAKRSEARKLTERQKEWNARTINTVVDETPALLNSWGLSISQTRNTRPTKEGILQPSSSTTPGPVWTNPTRIKQTMREIQEEEELKKKTSVKDKEFELSANRRAYAESAHKSNPPNGGAWTTVGVGGRHGTSNTSTTGIATATTTQSATVRQPPATTTTTANSHTIVSTKPTNVVRPPNNSSHLSHPNARVPSKSNSSSADDLPVPPSPEFIKWLRDALRGFNVGFNTEEFMTMLLAFPLDFPLSTVEVIQDMVYMNSNTMDGRRFAAEFCSKRRSDAANRSKSTDGRQSSLADIKTQPKVLQSELPFKIVKKKGKK